MHHNVLKLFLNSISDVSKNHHFIENSTTAALQPFSLTFFSIICIHSPPPCQKFASAAPGNQNRNRKRSRKTLLTTSTIEKTLIRYCLYEPFRSHCFSLFGATYTIAVSNQGVLYDYFLYLVGVSEYQLYISMNEKHLQCNKRTIYIDLH